MRRIFGFMIGILVGGLVGSALALIFAPASGSELREELRLRFNAFGQEVRRAMENKRLELQDRIEILRSGRTE